MDAHVPAPRIGHLDHRNQLRKAHRSPAHADARPGQRRGLPEDGGRRPARLGALRPEDAHVSGTRAARGARRAENPYERPHESRHLGAEIHGGGKEEGRVDSTARARQESMVAVAHVNRRASLAYVIDETATNTLKLPDMDFGGKINIPH